MLNQTPITRNSTLVLNWIFIPGLLLLVINDHYLKSEFPNWMTGKISDFAGLLIFPMFLQFLFPRLRRFSVLLTGLLFVFFKLPVSDAAIAVYDKIAIIPITRTVDYSDLIALSILPLSDYLCTSIGRGRYKMGTFTPGITTAIVVIPAALVFMAAIGLREELVRAAPPLAPAFAAIGLPVNLRGLEIRDLKSSLERDGTGTLLAVEGTIVNIRARKVLVPPVRIEVEGPDGQESYNWTAAAPKAQLADGESIDFRARLSDPPQEAHSVRVQFATQ